MRSTEAHIPHRPHPHHFHPLPPPPTQPLLRSLPRKRLDTIPHILERLLILLAHVTPLHLLAVVPLHLEGTEDDARVEAVDVFGWVAGQAGELLDEVCEGVHVAAGGMGLVWGLEGGRGGRKGEGEEWGRRIVGDEGVGGLVELHYSVM